MSFPNIISSQRARMQAKKALRAQKRFSKLPREEQEKILAAREKAAEEKKAKEQAEEAAFEAMNPEEQQAFLDKLEP